MAQVRTNKTDQGFPQEKEKHMVVSFCWVRESGCVPEKAWEATRTEQIGEKKKDSFFLQVCPGHGWVTPRLELSGLNSFGLNSRRPGKGLEQKMSECVPPRRNLPAPKEEGSRTVKVRALRSVLGCSVRDPPPRNPSSPPTPVHPQERKGKGGGLPRKKGGDPVHRKSFSVSAKRH